MVEQRAFVYLPPRCARLNTESLIEKPVGREPCRSLMLHNLNSWHRSMNLSLDCPSGRIVIRRGGP